MKINILTFFTLLFFVSSISAQKTKSAKTKPTKPIVEASIAKEEPKAQPAPTPADIAFTAKKYGVSEEEVKKKLGIK